MKLLFILLVLALLKVVWLHRVYYLLPPAELKRRARGHDAQAAAIYKVAVYNKELDGLLFLFGTLAAAGILIMAGRVGWWAALLAAFIIAWLVFWSPRPRLGGPLWRFCAFTSRYTVNVMRWLHPLLKLLGKLAPARGASPDLYEKEDFLQLISRQNRLANNRINEQDLQLAFKALTFGEKSVAQTMTSRKKLMFVSEEDVVGPLLLDELHKSGQVRFPVVRGDLKAAQPNVRGTLYLRDIIEIGQQNKGKVKDHMKKGVSYINEACDLPNALDAILKTHVHMLMVVNNFKEISGAISLEEVLEQILGPRVMAEFDRYGNLEAVAGLAAAKQKPADTSVKSD